MKEAQNAADCLGLDTIQELDAGFTLKLVRGHVEVWLRSSAPIDIEVVNLRHLGKTMHECLEELGDLPMFSMLEGPETVLPAREWIQRTNDERGFEIRDGKRNYGKTVYKIIGQINGPAIYKEAT